MASQKHCQHSSFISFIHKQWCVGVSWYATTVGGVVARKLGQLAIASYFLEEMASWNFEILVRQPYIDTGSSKIKKNETIFKFHETTKILPNETIPPKARVEYPVAVLIWDSFGDNFLRTYFFRSKPTGNAPRWFVFFRKIYSMH